MFPAPSLCVAFQLPLTDLKLSAESGHVSYLLTDICQDENEPFPILESRRSDFSNRGSKGPIRILYSNVLFTSCHSGVGYQKTLLPSNWGCMNCASVRAPACLVYLEKLLKICLLALAINTTQTPLRREPQGGTASIGMTKQVQTERGAEKEEHCSLIGMEMAGRSPDYTGILSQASPAS